MTVPLYLQLSTQEDLPEISATRPLLKKDVVFASTQVRKSTSLFHHSWLRISLMKSHGRGCTLIIRTGILLRKSKMITPRGKFQAWGQKNRSRALKWGIICLYSSNTFEVMIKTKSIVFLYFSISVILYSNFANFYKNAKIGKLMIS